HADAASPQLSGEISEIGVAGYENNNIRPHLDGKLERVDCHHHGNVSLVTALFGGRPVFGYHHESVRAQPMHELVLPIALFLPDRDGRWESGIDHYFDQLPSRVRPREKVTKLQPIQTAPCCPHRTADVRFVDKDQQPGPRGAFVSFLSHNCTCFLLITQVSALN